MSDKMFKIAKEAIDLDGHINLISCNGVKCKKCIFSQRNNNSIACCSDTPENYVKIAEEYLKSVENEDIPNAINENVNMDDLEIDFDTDAILESALGIDVPSIEMVEKENEDVKVERKMSLKEKILAKIDYKKIAEEIYEILEDDIVEEVANSFDEIEIAYDLVNGYRSDFIETAREVIVENIEQEINVDDVSDYLKEVAIDNID